MPAIRDANLRSGDLCEGIGLELLRPFAFVVPTPRTEDIGFDGVATIMRRAGRRLFAEDSFLVQVKSASIRQVDFVGDEVKWFRDLRLPLFILSVKLDPVSLELFSTYNATSHPNFYNRTALRLHLDTIRTELPGDEMVISLGPPALRWNPAEAADPTFKQLAYEVLKGWSDIEAQGIALRPLRMAFAIHNWATNVVPVLNGQYMVIHHPRDLQDSLKRICSQIQWLSMIALSDEELTIELHAGLKKVMNFMRAKGVDPDELKLLETFDNLYRFRRNTHMSGVNQTLIEE